MRARGHRADRRCEAHVGRARIVDGSRHRNRSDVVAELRLRPDNTCVHVAPVLFGQLRELLDRRRARRRVARELDEQRCEPLRTFEARGAIGGRRGVPELARGVDTGGEQIDIVDDLA